MVFINTGKHILTKGIPFIEPFTIHENFAFVAQQWLTDVIFYSIYSKFGSYGMFVLLEVINIFIIFVMYKLCLLVTENKIKLSLFITIVTDLFLEFSLLTTRPQVFDILLLLTEVYLLELYIKKKNIYYLIGLPIISILMINLHASIWLMAVVFMLPYFLGTIKLKWTTNEDYKLKPLIYTAIAVILVAFINPYKADAIKYLFNSYEIPYINYTVGEMMPINIKNCFVLFVCIFVVILSYYVNKKNKVNLRYLLLMLGTTYLLLEHYKGFLFFSISAILSLSYNFKDFFKDENKNYVKFKYMSSVIVILIIVFFTVASFTIELEQESDNPLYKLANYLDENASSDIKLYTNYNNGDYFEYRGYKVYLDARAEVFVKKNNKKEDILLEYYNLSKGTLNYREFLAKYNFDYLVIDSDELLYTYMKDTDYELVYETKEKDLFVKNKVMTYRIYKRK